MNDKHRDVREVSKFVILAAPRTGSTYLTTLLHSHPEIFCHGEVFTDKWFRYYVQQPDFQELKVFRSPRKIISLIWKKNFGNKGIGFKLLAGDSPTALNLILNSKLIKKIILKRRNKLRICISLFVAQQSHKFHLMGENKAKLVRIEIEPSSLLEQLKRFEHFYQKITAKLAETPQNFLEIYYEDLFETKTINNILNFIKVEPGSDLIKPILKKQNPFALKDIIINFSEIAKTLAGTEYEKDLYTD